MNREETKEGALLIAHAFEFLISRENRQDLEKDQRDFLRCCKAYAENSEDLRHIAMALNNQVSHLIQNPDLWGKIVKALNNENVPKYAQDRINMELREATTSRPEKAIKKRPVETRIYLMRNERNGFIKIGKSKNPLARETTLQSEDPEITLIKSWPGMPSDELRLHGLYQAFRVRGEWFRLKPEHIDEICEIMEAVVNE